MQGLLPSSGAARLGLPPATGPCKGVSGAPSEQEGKGASSPPRSPSLLVPPRSLGPREELTSHKGKMVAWAVLRPRVVQTVTTSSLRNSTSGRKASYNHTSQRTPEWVESAGQAGTQGTEGGGGGAGAPASWDLQPPVGQAAGTGACRVPAGEVGPGVRRLAGEGTPARRGRASQRLGRAAGPDTPPVLWHPDRPVGPPIPEHASIGQGSQRPGPATPACTLQGQGRGHSVWLTGKEWR